MRLIANLNQLCRYPYTITCTPDAALQGKLDAKLLPDGFDAFRRLLELHGQGSGDHAQTLDSAGSSARSFLRLSRQRSTPDPLRDSGSRTATRNEHLLTAVGRLQVRLHRCDETVTTSGKGFDETRIIGRIAQGFAQFVDSAIDAVVEIPKVSAPQILCWISSR